MKEILMKAKGDEVVILGELIKEWTITKNKLIKHGLEKKTLKLSFDI